MAFGVTRVLPAWPRQRAVELALGDPRSIVDLEMSWARTGAGDALRGGVWHFAPGTAPPSVATTVDLPDGTYDLDITMRRSDGETASAHRSITVADTSTIRVPIQ
jgi:hypothetical protein